MRPFALWLFVPSAPRKFRVYQQMREDSHVTMTLAIDSGQYDFQVIGVNGRDQLNAPFCFEIDLVSADPALDCPSFLQCGAWLQLACGGDGQGVHGRIHAMRQLHAGQPLSLYRLMLTPALQQLAATPRRQVFNGQSVPDIIAALLHGHQMPDSDFRFERFFGLYPARDHCLQYDESDLHFLCRLCEEEGISFRFEHAPDRHVLVFSDDPTGFAEWPCAITVEHLAERLSARDCYSTHAGEHYTPSGTGAASSRADADNQKLWMPYGLNTSPERLGQVRGRLLERLRCERRDIMGRSVQPWLCSGRVIRVEHHPDPLFNDQWLLTGVQHTAWQLAPLRGCSSREVMHMLQAMASAGAIKDGPGLLAVRPDGVRSPIAHYENRFQVIPWTMPFRPALNHPKSLFTGTELATQLADEPGRPGRVRIRYDWQTDDAPQASHARVVSRLARQPPGARLTVRFFEGDPDQPLVCGVLDNAALTPQMPQTAGLSIDSQTPLMLKSPRARLSITEDGIHYSPLAATAAAINDA